ncbi:siderophore-iron reductase FhuF [Achromobacter marplatensis]|uniref:siderophore-iron reductase FhuF n=1 Tax=Achromobacter marplatensis TaxID=470868 RepID=UPI0039F6D7E4
MIPFLAPYFPGEWRSHGQSLRLGAAGGPPARALLDDTARLRQTLERYRATQWPGADARAAASAWTLQYLWALLAPAVAAATGARREVPCAAAAMRLMLDGANTPVAFIVAELGPAQPDADTRERYGALVWEHLLPLADGIHAASRLPRKVVWAGAVRYLDALFDALRAMGCDVAEDRRLLLETASWSGDGRANPLCLPARIPPAHAPGPVYRECCLYYLLPGQTQCAACPLPRQLAPGDAAGVKDISLPA